MILHTLYYIVECPPLKERSIYVNGYPSDVSILAMYIRSQSYSCVLSKWISRRLNGVYVRLYDGLSFCKKRIHPKGGGFILAES